jgi:prepilin-type processing-associated H-X9-DG protein
MVISQGLVAHTNKYKTINSFNLAFIDGHVTTVNDKWSAADKDIRWPGSENVAGPDIPLDDEIDVLETEADGRDPSVSDADPNMYPYRYNSLSWWIRREQANDSSNPCYPNAPGAPTTPVDGKTDHPAVPWL